MELQWHLDLFWATFTSVNGTLNEYSRLILLSCVLSAEEHSMEWPHGKNRGKLGP